MVCLDDKHRVKVGEPGLPVVSVERGKKVLVALNQSFEVCDHDFTRFSLIRVTLLIDIPTSIDQSWYNGQVLLGLKDAVFEHVTELLLTKIGMYTDDH